MSSPLCCIYLNAHGSDRALELWLLGDLSLRGRVRVDWDRSERAPEAGGDTALGDPTAVLSLVVSSALALPAALESLRRWTRAQPPTSPPVLLRRGRTEVEIGPDTTADQLRELLAALEEPALNHADDSDRAQRSDPPEQA